MNDHGTTPWPDGLMSSWRLLGVVVLSAILNSVEVGSARGSTPVPAPRILAADSAFSATSPRSQILISVAADTTYDAATGYYTYSYEVTNDVTSPNSVAVFGLASAPWPLSITSPPEWNGFYGFDERDDVIVWAVTDTLTQPPPENRGNLYPSPFEIQPGETKTGFSFVTPIPPAEFGTVQFYAEGFDTIPGSFEEPYPTLFTSGVSGPTLGPGSAVSVEKKPRSTNTVRVRPPIPNPMTKSVSIAFYLPRDANVNLIVSDVSGRLIRVLAEGPRSAGTHSIAWDGMDSQGKRARPGVYFYKLRVDQEYAGAQRLVILP